MGQYVSYIFLCPIRRMAMSASNGRFKVTSSGVARLRLGRMRLRVAGRLVLERQCSPRLMAVWWTSSTKTCPRHPRQNLSERGCFVPASGWKSSFERLQSQELLRPHLPRPSQWNQLKKRRRKPRNPSPRTTPSLPSPEMAL